MRRSLILACLLTFVLAAPAAAKVPVSASSASGDTKTSSLVGGIVVASARTVKLQFTDGKAMTLRAKRPPKGWGSMLQARGRGRRVARSQE